MKYDVIVGSIGYVYSGKSIVAAEQVFNEYVKHSTERYGRAAGKSIYLLERGVLRREHRGALDTI